MPNYIVLASGVGAPGSSDFSVVSTDPVSAPDPQTAVQTAFEARNLKGNRRGIAVPVSQWNRFDVTETWSLQVTPVVAAP